MQRIANSIQLRIVSLVRTLNFLTLILALVPPAIICLFIFSFAQNVPTWDQWLYQRERAIAVKDGNLTFNELVKPYNGQRHLAETLTVVLLTYTTNWNTEIQAYLNLVLDAIALAVAFDIFRRLHQWSSRVILLMFSARQDPHWLMANYTHYGNLFLLLRFWVLLRRCVDWRGIVLGNLHNGNVYRSMAIGASASLGVWLSEREIFRFLDFLHNSLCERLLPQQRFWYQH
jgi:hypothetical protein